MAQYHVVKWEKVRLYFSFQSNAFYIHMNEGGHTIYT